MVNKILHFRNIQSAKNFAKNKKVLGKHENFFLKESRLNQDLHINFGIIDKEELTKTGLIKTNKNKGCYSFDASFFDNFQNLKRNAQIINVKDAAVILAEAGINKKSIVFDSGSGSGGLSLFLANFAKKVYSFDIIKENIDVCNKNKQFLKLDNIEFFNADITDKQLIKQIVKNKKCDVFTIDILNPEKSIDTVREFLVVGGYLVFYVTQLNQAKDVINEIDNSKDFSTISCKEVLHREWDLHDKKCKPKGLTNSHTGFLVFARKIC